MTKKQAEAEMKYRLAVLLLNDLLEKGKITKDGLLMYKKKLIIAISPAEQQKEITQVAPPINVAKTTRKFY